MKKILLLFGMLGAGFGLFGINHLNDSNSNLNKKVEIKNNDKLSEVAWPSHSLPSLITRNAVGIKLINIQNIKGVYFYQSKKDSDGVRWYQHSLTESTWDWAWCNGNLIDYSLEFQMHLQNNKDLYVVLNYDGFKYISNVATAYSTVYWTITSDTSKTPSRNAIIWNSAQVSSYSYATNFHTDFIFTDNSLKVADWESVPVTYHTVFNF